MTSKRNPYRSSSQRVQPLGLDPPYRSQRATRTGRSLSAPPDGRRRDACEGQTEIGGGLFENGASLRSRTDVHCARVTRSASEGAISRPENIFTSGEKPADGGKGVVLMMADNISGCSRWSCHSTGRGHNPIDSLEGPLDSVKDAIELHTHLEGERPPGAVIRRSRRTTGVRNVVGMVLGLEHVEHVRTKGLGGLHDKGARWIVFAAHAELRGRTMNGNPVLEQGIDELRRRQEVGLVGGQNVRPRIAACGIAKQAIVVTTTA